LGLGNEEVLDTAFVGYSIAECFSSPAAVQWLADYNTAGVGNFGEHFGSALDTFKRLIDNKVLRPNDINLTYADRENMIFNRKCAMVEDSVLLARTGSSYNGCTDEFGLMPFFNPGKDGDWARLYPVCYIGLNKHLEESANKEKYELILELMEYISSPDGQYALLGDTGAMISSLIGVPPPDVPEIADIMPALQHGRCSVFPVLKNAQSALREGLAGMITGKFTASDVAQAVDAQNAAPAKPVPPKILGEARDDFSLTDTGNFITDAMKKKSGCEIALFLDNGKDGQTNGKGVCARLYKGDVTSVDLDRILPDLRKNEKCVLWKVKMTGADLLRTLEYSIPIENIQASWFYYFSGLSMDYAPTAKTGAHTSNVRDEHGNAIDPNRTYSVAVMDYSVPPDACISCEKTNITIRSILEEALSGGAVSPAKDGRFNIISAK
ncbi:MAG: 5'-nucleotidase C-terminal domain-containing protein, partial [Clostridia bacterium]